jgi:hypothetical protein
MKSGKYLLEPEIRIAAGASAYFFNSRAMRVAEESL